MGEWEILKSETNLYGATTMNDRQNTHNADALSNRTPSTETDDSTPKLFYTNDGAASQKALKEVQKLLGRNREILDAYAGKLGARIVRE